MDVPNAAESNVGYTHHSDLAVEDGADFIVADGDDFIADVLGIGTDVTPLLVMVVEFVLITLLIEQVMDHQHSHLV